MLARIVALPFRGLILAYRYLVSPFFPGACRYHPSCSAYAEDAFRTHGAFKGGFLAIHRIIRCNPWGGSGYDPVPNARDIMLESAEGSPESS